MPTIPDYEPSTARAIYESYTARAEDWRRPHLGASIIGRECERELWYLFRWAIAPDLGRGKDFAAPGQVLRLFERGMREENWLARDLRRSGVKLQTKDPETKKQFSWMFLNGHFGGSADGVGRCWKEGAKPAIWECKTMSGKYWRALVKHGMFKSKPEHYAQVQVYMMGSKLPRAMYFAVNKETDGIHVIRVRYDKAFAESMLCKAERVVLSAKPPRKLSQNPAFFKCKMCDAQHICHSGDATIEYNCRTCSESRPSVVSDGKWECALLDKALSVDEQREGCEHWSLIPELNSPEQIM